jgi:Serine kinase of the HPr protein, regulates carbohydrate metabolism
MQGIVNFHGVVFECQGRGILITGASGIGKTTSALVLVKEGNYWIADDIAVVKRNQKGELIARGHAKIKNLLHTKETGIVPVKKILDSNRIKKQTTLAGIIEVRKASLSRFSLDSREMEILGTKLPCVQVRIPSSGYFNKNLLKKAILQFKKDS